MHIKTSYGSTKYFLKGEFACSLKEELAVIWYDLCSTLCVTVKNANRECIFFVTRQI